MYKVIERATNCVLGTFGSYSDAANFFDQFADGEVFSYAIIK